MGPEKIAEWGKGRKNMREETLVSAAPFGGSLSSPKNHPTQSHLCRHFAKNKCAFFILREIRKIFLNFLQDKTLLHFPAMSYLCSKKRLKFHTFCSKKRLKFHFQPWAGNHRIFLLSPGGLRTTGKFCCGSKRLSQECLLAITFERSVASKLQITCEEKRSDLQIEFHKTYIILVSINI